MDFLRMARDAGNGKAAEAILEMLLHAKEEITILLPAPRMAASHLSGAASPDSRAQDSASNSGLRIHAATGAAYLCARPKQPTVAT
jgi:hypothetical protein